VLRGSGGEGGRPASYAQSALWRARELAPHPAAYNLLWLLEIRGSLDPALLRGALSRTVERHDALRAVFTLTPDGLEQRIVPPAAIACPVEVLDSPGAPALEQLSRQFGHAPFDLAAGPLFRFRLLRTGEGEHVLLCAFHHLVIDGHSWRLFVDELLQHLSGAAVPPLGSQCPDFAAWQRHQLAAEAWSGAREY